MTWAVYCRYNQARSIIAGALLRQLFPQQEVVTGGIQAQQNYPIPTSVASIARAWSMPLLDQVSREVDDEWVRLQNPFILAADDLVASRLQEVHPKSFISTLSQFADDVRLIPVDPTGFSFSKLAIELAKVLVLTNRWANHINQEKLNVGSILALDENQAWWNSSKIIANPSHLYIDVDFLIPANKPWYKGKSVQLFDPRKLNSFDYTIAESNNIVLRSRFEIDSPEHIYTSIGWKNFIVNLSNFKKVVLVSAFNGLLQSRSPIPLLGLIHSRHSEIWPKVDTLQS